MDLKFYIQKAPKKTEDWLIPVSIIKGSNKKLHNKFLVLDRDPKKTKEKCGKRKGYTELEIDEDSCFNILPSTDPNKRDMYYICGASGSGKSYVAKMIATNYHKLYPNRPIYVISKLECDETLDEMDFITRLDYSEWARDPPNINNIKDCMVIFDDCDGITGKVGKAVHQFMEDIAITGRKHGDNQGNISMLYITHHITNYSKTALILNETQNFIIYPRATNPKSMKYLLENYLGFDTKQIKQLKKLNTRWLWIRSHYPQFIISAHTARLLNQDDSDTEEEETLMNVNINQ